MLFAYIDDGRLEVIADEAEARSKYDGSDVENGVVRLFDAAGKPLVARFPARSERRILGVRISSDPGPFELEPAVGKDAETLAQAMGPVVILMPNRWFKDLDAVHAHLLASR